MKILLKTKAQNLKHLGTIFIWVCIFFVLPINVYAQPHIQIVEALDGMDLIHHSIVEYPGDRYVVASTVTPGFNEGESDILLLMTDNSGNIIWMQYLDYQFYYGNDPSHEFVGSLMVDQDKNIVLTGYIKRDSHFVAEMLIAKFDENGNLLNDILLTYDYITGTGDEDEIYGLDIEQTKEGDYIITGIMSWHHFACMNCFKHSFVLRIGKDLNGSPQWVKKYQSTYSIDNLDSFNHILKVENYDFFEDEMYLLSGSTANNTDQLVHNVLIDQNGNELWSTVHSSANFPGTTGGVSALYNPSNNKFYVLYKVYEGSIQNGVYTYINVLDGLTGNITKTFSIHNRNNLVVNGMQWADPKSNGDYSSIVFSGYHLDSALGSPILFSVDISNDTVNWSYEYPIEFDVNDYQNLFSINQMVQPLNNMYANFFYEPKPLIRTETSEGVVGYQYSSIHRRPGNPNAAFELALIHTDSNGIVGNGDEECMREFELFVYNQDKGTEYLSIPSQEAIFHRVEVKYLLNVVPVDLATYLTCNMSSANIKSSSKSFNQNKISIFPNPTDGIVYLNSIENIENVSLYNLSGQVISIANMDNSLDLSGLSSGVYFVKITVNGKVETFRIIKN